MPLLGDGDADADADDDDDDDDSGLPNADYVRAVAGRDSSATTTTAPHLLEATNLPTLRTARPTSILTAGGLQAEPLERVRIVPHAAGRLAKTTIIVPLSLLRTLLFAVWIIGGCPVRWHL